MCSPTPVGNPKSQTTSNAYFPPSDLHPCSGIEPRTTFLEDALNEDGKLREPDWRTVDVNLKGVLNTVTLGLHHLRKNGLAGGSIVITASVTSRPPDSNSISTLTRSHRLHSLRRRGLR